MEREDSIGMKFRDYLLGQLAESEAKDFEERLMDDDVLFKRVEAMIDLAEDDLVEDYLRRELDESERSAFELRLLNSPKIREKVILTKALLHKAQQEPISLDEGRSTDRVSWTQTLGRLIRPLPAIAASLTLIVFAGGAWSTARIWRLEDRLAEILSQQERLTSSQEQLTVQLTEERSLTERLSRELESAVEKSSALENAIEGLGGQVASAIASALLSPGLSRSSGQIKTLSISSAHQLVELRLDLGLDEYPAYRVALCNAAGDEIFSQNRLASFKKGNQVLVISQFPAQALGAGQYLLKLSGITSTGSLEQLELYHFRLQRN